MKPLSRRLWLQQGSALLALAFLGRTAARADETGTGVATPAGVPAQPIHRFRVGDFEASVLFSGFMEVKPQCPPEAAEAAFADALAALGQPASLLYPFNVLLLCRGTERILIDAGPAKTEGKPYHLLSSLAALGLAPDDITHVILTHAHFDHSGGLLDARRNPVFPRATHLCLPEEIDFWTSEQPDFSELRMDPKFLWPHARQVFARVPFVRIGTQAELPAGLTPILSPGHTPGHLTLRIESRGEVLHHISDLTHHAGLWLPHPEWSLASDSHPAQASRTRTAAFRALAASGERVFGFHLPFPALGRIATEGGTFRWLPEESQRTG
ncbi:MAG: MBL fold metallo-hydrolase [Candidatus Didemnitutus sp.]|nr:MBL fold metallo-hydrolase [Candidatus Didemnitutus sp.]